LSYQHEVVSEAPPDDICGVALRKQLTHQWQVEICIDWTSLDVCEPDGHEFFLLVAHVFEVVDERD